MLWVQWAAYNGHLHCVRWFIEKGVHLNQTDDEGRSAGLKLHSRFDTWFSWVWTASLNGHVDCVKVLVDNGADFSIANNNGATPGGCSMILFQNQMIFEFWLQLKRESWTFWNCSNRRAPTCPLHWMMDVHHVTFNSLFFVNDMISSDVMSLFRNLERTSPLCAMVDRKGCQFGPNWWWRKKCRFETPFPIRHLIFLSLECVL